MTKTYRISGPKDEVAVDSLKDELSVVEGTHEVDVDLDEVTHAHVHVVLKGDAVGLKTAGTLLMHPVTELTVECKLKDLPDEIVVNVKDLEAGGIIHAGDIELPSGVKLLSDADGIVAQITHSGGDAESAEEAEVSSEAEPEVIREKKPEGEDK